MCSSPWSGSNCTDCGDNNAWRYSGPGRAKGLPCQRIPHEKVNRGNGTKHAAITYTVPKAVNSVFPAGVIQRLCKLNRFGIKTGCNALCGVCMPTARHYVTFWPYFALAGHRLLESELARYRPLEALVLLTSAFLGPANCDSM